MARESKLVCDNCGTTIPAKADRLEVVTIVWGPIPTIPTNANRAGLFPHKMTSHEKVARIKTYDYCSRGCVTDGVSRMEEGED